MWNRADCVTQSDTHTARDLYRWGIVHIFMRCCTYMTPRDVLAVLTLGMQVGRLAIELKDAQNKLAPASADDQSNKDLSAKVAQLRRSLKYATFEYTQGKQLQVALEDEVL